MKLLIYDTKLIRDGKPVIITVEDNKVFINGRERTVRFDIDGIRNSTGGEFFSHAVISMESFCKKVPPTVRISDVLNNIESLGYKVWKYSETTRELKTWNDFS